jgi:hypothetical protein
LAALITIIALGDSTTAGTPGFKSPLESPPDDSGNIESQYAYWLTKMAAALEPAIRAALAKPRPLR